MLQTYGERQQVYRKFLEAGVIAAVCLVAAVLGHFVPLYTGYLVLAIALTLVGVIAVFFDVRLVVLLLIMVSFFLTFQGLFSVQGRVITFTHLLGGLVVVSWLMRKLVVDRSLKLTPSHLNAPMLGLIFIWLLTWMVGLLFWDPWVTTEHRPVLFFVAEWGQLVMMIGICWAVAECVQNMRWIKIVCGTMIVANLLTFFVGDFQGNQLPIALALIYSLLLYTSSTRLQMGLLVALVIAALGLLHVNRIPFYLANMAVILVVSLLRSKRLFLIMALLAALVGVWFIKPLWDIETSVSSRIELAKYGWQVFKSRPLLGIGPTHYRSYILLYYPYQWRSVKTGYLLPHNYWIYHFVNTGIVGIVGVAWFIIMTLRESLSLLRKVEDGFSRALCVSVPASLVALFISGLGGHRTFLPTYGLETFAWGLPIWILLGLMISRSQIETTS
jgi:hypothetical protein